jgi:hypothetical protein
VTLTETPGTNATFAGWGEDCGGSSATCSLVMSTPKAVTASFNQASTQKSDSPEEVPGHPQQTASRSRATFAAHSLGRPLVVRTSAGWAVTLRFFTSRLATGLVRLSLNRRPVGRFTFSAPRGGVLIGPFDIARPGGYHFGLTLSDRRGAIARLTWNLVV